MISDSLKLALFTKWLMQTICIDRHVQHSAGVAASYQNIKAMKKKKGYFKHTHPSQRSPRCTRWSPRPPLPWPAAARSPYWPHLRRSTHLRSRATHTPFQPAGRMDDGLHVTESRLTSGGSCRYSTLNTCPGRSALTSQTKVYRWPTYLLLV